MATTKSPRAYSADQFNSVLALVREYQTLDTKQAKLSPKLLAIAGEFGTDADAFASVVNDVAAHWKEKAKRDALPRNFIQTKSNIIAAMKLGICPADYPTESAMRTALNTARKAAKSEQLPTLADSLRAEVSKLQLGKEAGSSLVQLLHTLNTVDAAIADKLAVVLAEQVNKALEQVKATA